MINNFDLSILRLENSFKNLLIFFPLFFSRREIVLNDVISLFIGFVIFTVMVSICYVTNDYTDRKKDKKNKLKSENIVLRRETIIVLNLLLIFKLIIIFQLTNFGNFYLIGYLITFYLYNFFLKNFFLLDVILLVSFYILRLFYGAELLDITISYWFLIFFSTLFLNLALFKRMIQILVNNLKKAKNNIIKYSIENISIIKKIIICSTIINFLTVFLYFFELFQPETFNFLSNEETRYNYDFISLVCVLLGYIFWTQRVIKLVFEGNIRCDIYTYILTDKVTYLIFAIFSVIIFI